MKEFVGLTAKTYASLMEDHSEHEKAKETKNCVIKRELAFKNYTDCLFNDKTMLKSQQRLKSDCHNGHIEQSSSNDDKRLQTFVKITTFPYRINAFKVFESDMLSKK